MACSPEKGWNQKDKETRKVSKDHVPSFLSDDGFEEVMEHPIEDIEPRFWLDCNAGRLF
jgi:hypothetical protein